MQLPWLVNLASLVCCVDRWLSCKALALHSVVTGSISRGRDHGYTLLMRPNKVETAVQWFHMLCTSVCRIFWWWWFNLQLRIPVLILIKPKMVRSMATSFFRSLIFENCKTVPVFTAGFDLQGKHNAKLYPYFMSIRFDKLNLNLFVAQSVGVVEYIDCISGYDTKLDGEATVLEPCWMWSTPLLSLLPDPLWLEW